MDAIPAGMCAFLTNYFPICVSTKITDKALLLNSFVRVVSYTASLHVGKGGTQLERDSVQRSSFNLSHTWVFLPLSCTKGIQLHAKSL